MPPGWAASLAVGSAGPCACLLGWLGRAPKVYHEWNHLRLQDFRYVADYNHAVHKICSKLKFCEKEPTDADKIEKTLSTILPFDRVLQQ